jgi:hypothetical protein
VAIACAQSTGNLREQRRKKKRSNKLGKGSWDTRGHTAQARVKKGPLDRGDGEGECAKGCACSGWAVWLPFGLHPNRHTEGPNQHGAGHRKEKRQLAGKMRGEKTGKDEARQLTLHTEVKMGKRLK